MRLIGWPSGLTLLLHGLAVLAVAAIVHIVTIFAAPSRAAHDGFSRIAVLAPVNVMTRLPARDRSATIPFRDPAMVRTLCRFDVGEQPLRVTLQPIDRGFVALSFYDRRTTAFYGLTIRASERSPIVMAVMTADQKAARDGQDGDDAPNRDLDVVTPSPQGFIVIETPAGDDGASAWADANLAHVACGPADGKPDLRP